MASAAAKRAQFFSGWSVTPGQVFVSKLETVAATAYDPSGSTRRQPGGLRIGEPTEQRFSIRYRYQVDEREYEGNQVTPNHFTATGDPERWARQYPLGTKVTVHYNPARPDQAALESGASAARTAGRWAPGLMILGLGALVVGVIRAGRTGHHFGSTFMGDS